MVQLQSPGLGSARMRGCLVRWRSFSGAEDAQVGGRQWAICTGLQEDLRTSPLRIQGWPCLVLDLRNTWLMDYSVADSGSWRRESVPLSLSRCLSRKQKVGGEILENWLWDFVADTALLAGLGAPWVVETPGRSCRVLAGRGSAASASSRWEWVMDCRLPG